MGTRRGQALVFLKARNWNECTEIFFFFSEQQLKAKDQMEVVTHTLGAIRSENFKINLNLL